NRWSIRCRLRWWIVPVENRPFRSSETMAAAASRRIPPDIDYPSGDGLPMAETPLHRQNLTDQIAMLSAWFAGEPLVYVSGNMFVYYVRGNRNKHVAPDVFVVRGVPKDKPRKTYRIWEEGKG